MTKISSRNSFTVTSAHAHNHELRADPGLHLSANVGIDWDAGDCHFSDWRYLPSIDPGQHFRPDSMSSLLKDAAIGDCLSHAFAPGELFPAYRQELVHRLPVQQFKSCRQSRAIDTPRTGRFYCSTHMGTVAGIEQGSSPFCRIIDVTGEELEVDFNHPLASRAIKLSLHIHKASADSCEFTAENVDLASFAGESGPGMQAEMDSSTTDFWSDQPFKRIDEQEDSKAFQPSMTPFWDRMALQQVSEFYSRELNQGDNILDLMAGVHSPLQESSIVPASVTGAGLHLIELENNPILNRRIALNVNDPGTLPFSNASFDAVLIHAAFEYALNPQQLIAEVARVLRSAGTLIISFSNHFVDSKAIQIWNSIEEFERTGLVLSLLRENAGFSDFLAISQRGLTRPSDDNKACEYDYSDPVFIVRARKTP